ncbi:DUF1563 domain-containing protein [Ligilactobacillus salivarius]
MNIVLIIFFLIKSLHGLYLRYFSYVHLIY